MVTWTLGAGDQPVAGNVLHFARTRAGLSLRELGERTGTGHAAISRVEAGREEPTLGRLARLVAACGFRLDLQLARDAAAADERAER